MRWRAVAPGHSDATGDERRLGRGAPIGHPGAGRCPSAGSVRLVSGLDHGHYEGHAVDGYVKDLPLDRVPNDVLVATELNGEPLPLVHGFPARLLVPGFYGTNSVKWLKSITLADRRADGPFTTALYNDPAGDGMTRPVWAVMPESAFVTPAPNAVLGTDETTIWGWAWGELPIKSVALSTDGGASWCEAELEPRRQFAWQRFSLAWRPDRVGDVVLMARAMDESGATEPKTSARNAMHAITIEVCAGDLREPGSNFKPGAVQVGE